MMKHHLIAMRRNTQLLKLTWGLKSFCNNRWINNEIITGVNAPQNSINTTELTRRIQAGSRRAETEFAETYSRALLLMLHNRTQNPDIAKDCCQQALLITLIKLRAGEIAKPESLLSFLRNTATNVAKAHFRKERRYTPLNGELFATPVGTSNDAEQKIDCETIRQMLNDILDLLTVERDKEILRRFYLRDENKSNIRRDMDISKAHFDRVIYRARGRLRQLLDSHEDVKTLLSQSLSDRTLLSHSRSRSSRLQKAKSKHLEACWSCDEKLSVQVSSFCRSLPRVSNSCRILPVKDWTCPLTVCGIWKSHKAGWSHAWVRLLAPFR